MSDRYFGDVLNAFNDGVQLDLRVKMALSFIQQSPGFLQFASGLQLEEPNPPFADKAAILALEIADALLDEGRKRGWVKDLPEDANLNFPTAKHVERQVRRQIFANGMGQRISAEEASRVQPALAVFPGRPNGT